MFIQILDWGLFPATKFVISRLHDFYSYLGTSGKIAYIIIISYGDVVFWGGMDNASMMIFIRVFNAMVRFVNYIRSVDYLSPNRNKLLGCDIVRYLDSDLVSFSQDRISEVLITFSLA